MDLGLHFKRFWFIYAALAVGIVVGGWQAHWWLYAQTVNHTSQIQSSSYSAQLGIQTAVQDDVDQVDQIIAGIPQSVDPGSDWNSALAYGNAACRQFERLNPSALAVPADMQTWGDDNCALGELAMSSPIRLRQGNGGS